MSVIIEQQPLYRTLPVGQDIIFTVSSDTIIANRFKPKFIAQIYVSDQISNLGSTTTLVATLKVTPNNRGRGIFSLEPILSSYVKAQNEGIDFIGTSISKYKTTPYSNTDRHPIHLIDQLCLNNKNALYFSVDFNIEYFVSATSTTSVNFAKPFRSASFLFYNGVLDYDKILKNRKGQFGYNLDADKFVFNNKYGTLGKFLTNAPTEQDARLTDYGTLSYFNWLNISNYSFDVGLLAPDSPSVNAVSYFEIIMYNSSNVNIGSFNVLNNVANGGWSSNNEYSATRIMYLGAFPANFDGAAHAQWIANKANTSYYTIQAYDDEDQQISLVYKINIVSDSCYGYEAIRLAWLNSHGTWDYYTFKKKSVKSLQTNRTQYTQSRGTWNEKTFEIDGYRGGKKNFRVNTKQLISINTDFINESESVWFENLINSTEVYIIEGYSGGTADTDYGMINKYVEPVTVTTSSYVRKTKVNDKLIQYTFELEKTHNKRSHTV